METSGHASRGQTCFGHAGPQGQVCYYSGPQDALYEKLGHAEVVQVELDGGKTQQEMQKFADVSLSASGLLQTLYLGGVCHPADACY